MQLILNVGFNFNSLLQCFELKYFTYDPVLWLQHHNERRFIENLLGFSSADYAISRSMFNENYRNTSFCYTVDNKRHITIR